MLESDKKIYEIAEETGFQSSVNFNYVFNRFAGISPKMFREQFERNEVDSNEITAWNLLCILGKGMERRLFILYRKSRRIRFRYFGNCHGTFS
ncbi:MAG: hypothetical protein ACLTAF_09770 [Blautia coccoides]